jgi:hypothetical protein
MAVERITASAYALRDRGIAMTRVFENKTIDDIRLGDSAAITRTFHSADL